MKTQKTSRILHRRASHFVIGLLALSVTLTANAGERLYYYHTDHLGTPQVMTDSQGQVVWKGHYRPFGEVEIEVEEVVNNLRFAGQYFDQETGNYYNYFREYDPTTGRYLQSDPIGLDGGLNTYLYANANPNNYIDPTGNIVVADDVIIIGGTIIVGACIATNCTKPIADAIGNAVDTVVEMCSDKNQNATSNERYITVVQLKPVSIKNLVRCLLFSSGRISHALQLIQRRAWLIQGGPPALRVGIHNRSRVEVKQKC